LIILALGCTCQIFEEMMGMWVMNTSTNKVLEAYDQEILRTIESKVRYINFDTELFVVRIELNLHDHK
jgi:hypothetical protein